VHRVRPSSQHHLLAAHDGSSHEQQRIHWPAGRYEVAGPALQAALRSDEGLQATDGRVAPSRRQLDGEELGAVAKVEAEGRHPSSGRAFRGESTGIPVLKVEAPTRREAKFIQPKSKGSRNEGSKHDLAAKVVSLAAIEAFRSVL